jgi:2-hydroxychromene-2-carboxylate isomerase
MTSKTIDFFYFFGSTYTYLTVMRIEPLAAEAGLGIRWRPFDVRTLMIEQNNIPFRDKPVKARYMWRDIERRADRYGIPFEKPPVYPVEPDLVATRVGLVAAEEGWIANYTRETYRAWFLRNEGPGTGGSVERVLQALGKETADVMRRAGSAELRERLDAETARARELGIFGSPTFVVGDEIFWGDDRLDDALAWVEARAA